MTFRITDDCIECQACLEVCAYQAISQVPAAEAGLAIVINPSACTHCWPFDQHPRCVLVCPVDRIVVDPDQPVPLAQLIRRDLKQVLNLAGPFEAARMTARMRQWVRDWFAGAIWDADRLDDADRVLDFYNFLSLMETEFAPGDTRMDPTNTALTRAGSNS
jgi:NAD-dependent dihydropyrimidine dehydrogenase PreA subunit